MTVTPASPATLPRHLCVPALWSPVVTIWTGLGHLKRRLDRGPPTQAVSLPLPPAPSALACGPDVPRDLLQDLSRAHICPSFWPGQRSSCQAAPGPLGWPLTHGPATLRTGNPGSVTPSAPVGPRHQAQRWTVAFRPSPRLPHLPWSARCASVCVPSGPGTRTHPRTRSTSRSGGRPTDTGLPSVQPHPTRPVANNSPGHGSVTWHPRPHGDPGVSPGH